MRREPHSDHPQPLNLRSACYLSATLIGLVLGTLVFLLFAQSLDQRDRVLTELGSIRDARLIVARLAAERLEMQHLVRALASETSGRERNSMRIEGLLESALGRLERLKTVATPYRGLSTSVLALDSTLGELAIRLARHGADVAPAILSAATASELSGLIERTASALDGIDNELGRRERLATAQIRQGLDKAYLLAAAIVAGVLLLLAAGLLSLDKWLLGPVRLVTEAMRSAALNRDLSSTPAVQSLEIYSLINAFRDMGEKVSRRQAEVNRLSAWQLAMLDSAEYGIISTDTHGVIATFNRTSARLLGYTPGEVIGKHTPGIIHDPDEVREYAAELSEELGQTVEPGFDTFVIKSRLGTIDEREWTFIRKDGSRFPVYLSVTAIRDASGVIVGYLGTFFDLSERKAFQANLHESESRYQALFNNASDAILLFGRDATIVECNPAATDMLGRSRELLLGSSIHQYSSSTQPDGRPSRELAREKVAAALAGEPQFFEWRHLRYDGTPFDTEVSLSAVTIGELPHLLATVRDVTERKHLTDQLAFQAGHDGLTDLPNRKTLQKSFDRFRQYADKTGKQVVLFLLDLDRFKEINDTVGHHVGDQLLMQIGPRLECACAGESALIARLGGDEFAILSIVEQNEDRVSNLAQCYLNTLQEPFELDGIRASIGASIGIACYPQHGRDSHALLRAADVAMYHAKRNNLGLKIYTPEIDDYSKQRLNFATELAEAVRLGQLVLHYQPKIDIRSGLVTGFEALVRWQHPERGLLMPGEFLDLVEIGDVIHPFTRRVIELAIDDKKHLNQLGYRQPVAINLSARNLLDDDCFHALDAALAARNLSPAEVELELTESSVMHDPERAITLLNRFRQQGTGISIDDFGTGYSSLSYLRQLPVNALKIDRSFIIDMESNTQDSAIVRSTIALAHSLDLVVVAEGVENPNTLALLDSMDCDHAQGFGICRPCPLEQLLGWLDTREHKLRVVS